MEHGGNLVGIYEKMIGMLDKKMTATLPAAIETPDYNTFWR